MNNLLISVFMASTILLVSTNFIIENKKEVTIKVEEIEFDNKEVTESKKFEVSDIILENHSINKEILCHYPQIISLEDYEFARYINNEIAKNIQGYITEIEYLVDESTLPDELYKYIVTYDKYIGDKYVSLIINQTYETGGVRSNKWKDIYNIDLEKEQIIYLSNLFNQNVDYEKNIIEEINKQSKDKNIIIMNGNDLKNLSEKQKFYIKDDKLIIYFDPFEIASSKYGALEFEMPFRLNQEGYFEI